MKRGDLVWNKRKTKVFFRPKKDGRWSLHCVRNIYLKNKDESFDGTGTRWMEIDERGQTTNLNDVTNGLKFTKAKIVKRFNEIFLPKHVTLKMWLSEKA